MASPWGPMIAQAQNIPPRSDPNAPTPEEIAMSQNTEPMDGGLSQDDMEAMMMSQGQPAAGPMPAPRTHPSNLVAAQRILKARAQGPASQTAVPYDLMMRDLAQQYGDKSKEALIGEQQGIGQLENNINQARQAPTGVDFTPLAAYFDSTVEGSHLLPAAQAMRPETAQQREEKLINLQNMLQERRSAASKNQLSSLKEQIDAYKASKIDPLDRAMKEAKIGFYANNNRAGLQQNQQDMTAHNQTIQALRNNKTAQTRLNSILGLDNAQKIITDAPKVTPQIFHDYQQAIAGAAIRGGSGVGERAERYMTSAGIDAKKVRQFISGEPMDIGKDDPMLKAIQGFAASERGQLQKQYGQILDSVSGGHGSMYSRRPDLKGDLNSALQGYKDLTAAPEDASSEDLTKMSNEELQQYIDSHNGGK